MIRAHSKFSLKKAEVKQNFERFLTYENIHTEMPWKASTEAYSAAILPVLHLYFVGV